MKKRNLLFCVDSDTADAIIMQNIAADALGTLIPRLHIREVTKNGFDAVPVGQNSNKYIVPVIEADEADDVSTRAPGADVVPSDITPDGIEITATQKYFAYPMDQSFADSNASGYEMAFAQVGVDVVARGIEKEAYKQLSIFTGAQAADWQAGGSGLVRYDDLRYAKVRQSNKAFPEDERFAILSVDGMDAALAEADFSDYEMTGYGEHKYVGKPQRPLQGYIPRQSPFLFDPVTIGAQDPGQLAEDLDDNETVVDIDLIAGGTIYPGAVMVCESEKMVIIAAVNNGGGAWTLTVIRGAHGSTAAAHADNTVVTWLASKTNLALHKNAVMTIFPKQRPFNDQRGIKVEAVKDDIHLYILREPNPKKNGSWLYTMSVNFGLKVLRPIGGVQRIAKN
jgi:hypothetical protein